TDAIEALAKLQSFLPEVLVTDVLMPSHDGFSVMNAAHQRDPLLAVVVMTGFGSIPDAVRAMRAGAEHYLAKPVNADELLRAVASAVGRRRLRRQGAARHRGAPAASAPWLVGTSPPMQMLARNIALLAPTSSTVLIVG